MHVYLIIILNLNSKIYFKYLLYLIKYIVILYTYKFKIVNSRFNLLITWKTQLEKVAKWWYNCELNRKCANATVGIRYAFISGMILLTVYWFPTLSMWVLNK